MIAKFALLLLVATSAEGLRGSRKTSVPAWACDLKAGPSAVVGFHRIYASGNAALDKQDGEAIEKITRFRQNATAQDEAKLLKEATVETKLAKKESDLSEMLGKKAKLEASKDAKAALKDSAASTKAVSDGAKAMEAAKKAVEKAKEEAKSTKEATATWESDAKFLKASAIVEDAKKQNVQAVDSKSLTSLVKDKKKDLLVVFYAPWCPHCQTFVMHDAAGNPEKAPLELFNQELKTAGATETLTVVKYDTQADASIPADFAVQYIPATYIATADGKVVGFQGNPHDTDALKTFIKKNAPRTKGI